MTPADSDSAFYELVAGDAACDGIQDPADVGRLPFHAVSRLCRLLAERLETGDTDAIPVAAKVLRYFDRESP